MRSNLLATYWILFLISIISSTLLFLIVASEATKIPTPNSDDLRHIDSVNFASPDQGSVANEAAAAAASVVADNVNIEIHSQTPRDDQSDEILNSVIIDDNTLPDGLTTEEENVVVVVKSDSEVPSDNDDSVNFSNSQEDIHDADVAEEDGISEERLPDLPQNPTVITLGEKSPELHLDTVEDVDIDLHMPKPELTQNDTELDGQDGEKKFPSDFVILNEVDEVKPPPAVVDTSTLSKDDKSPKIDDSGGGGAPDADSATADDVVPNVNATQPASSAAEVNLTTEEVPIPVFSEWAQKQMEEAEKEVVGSSAQKKNATTGTKPPPAKQRTKNYASPDCGAKIIASNSDAQRTGALLTSTKDEYMLSPCDSNRIWFVVELCEAIQAEKIDLANFELFSSSPKNFTVAVSNRFPTREWSNVGRFVGEDSRNVQSFDLHPHLFGKFVRVDIQSHYNKEHFCPVSLFRVFGTSEFEAFETENRLNDDLDDYDDDETVDQGHLKNENNLFKSASDAVLSIVKKAAEVLVKTNSNKTDLTAGTPETICITPKTGQFACDTCSHNFVENVNYLLSCRYYQLIRLLSVDRIRSHLITSQICAKQYGLETGPFQPLADCKTESDFVGDRKQSYYLSVLPSDYIASLCHLLAAAPETKMSVVMPAAANNEDALNLTIDRKKSNFEEMNNVEIPATSKKGNNKKVKAANKTDKIVLNVENVVLPTKELPKEPEKQPDVNMFNVPESSESLEHTTEMPIIEPTQQQPPPSEVASSNTTPQPSTEAPSTSQSTIAPTATMKPDDKSKEIEMEPSSWDSIDKLLSEQQTVAGDGSNLNQNSQQRNPSGHHSESVFIRLSNRIKALERNMSLSGQYLEELSRRYKKQVEELQHSFAKTQQGIEDQNRYIAERERILIEENHRLKDDLEELSFQLRAWIVLLIIVGAIVVFQILLSFYLARTINRTQKKLVSSLDEEKESPGGEGKRMYRRKSVEGVPGHQTPSPKVRRPSEEAMYIHGSYTDLLIPEEDILTVGNEDELSESRDEFGGNPKYRQRKRSVCYTSDDNLLLKRKTGSKIKLKRQESAPGDYVQVPREQVKRCRDIEQLIFEEDYENFIPGSDLAYNEFMPDGPSGMKITLKESEGKGKTKKSVKVRRLSSPAFLKSSFNKITSSKKNPHESTSWEWYRSKKSSSQPNGKTDPTSSSSAAATAPEIVLKVNGFQNHHHQPSPNSSLCEVLNLNGTAASSSENSLRTSEISVNTNTSMLSNGNHSSSGSSSRGSKKSRSFKKMFKKVF